jgi:thymidylate synthase
MNTLDKSYQALLQDILDNGIRKEDRTGTGTLSVFGRQIRHKMSEGFPLLTTKKMYFKGIVTELLWFLSGDTNIKYLVDNDCHIWDGDAYKNYLTKGAKLNEELGGVPDYYTQEEFINKIKTNDEFANKWGELGPVYGKQWRKWDVPKILTIERGKIENSIGTEWGSWERNPIDQIQNLINDLKTNPDSRRLMVSAWNVGELDQMTLPPCHYGFQVYTRELSWYDDLDKIKEIYVNWSLAKSSGGYAGDIKTDTIESANQIFVNGWQNNKDPYTGKPLIELECFSSIPKRAISLMWNQRSVDTFLGLPFNIASYGLLLEIIAKEVNMVPDELIGNLGDTHLYLNHIEQAKEQIGQPIFEESLTLYPNGPMNEGIKKQIIIGHTREPYPLPKLMICEDMRRTDGFKVPFDELDYSLIKLIDYQSHPSIKAPLSN